MRPRFLHLGVSFDGGPRTLEVEAYLNTYTPDWLRYSANTWMIWTSYTPQQLSDAIKPLFAHDQTRYLISVLDASAGMQGMSTQFVWDWINRPRDTGWTPPQPRAIPTLPPPGPPKPGTVRNVTPPPKNPWK